MFYVQCRKTFWNPLASCHHHSTATKLLFCFVKIRLIYVVYRYAILEELAGLGATVHTCTRNEAQLNECLHEWKVKGFRVTGFVCDAVSQAQREKLISTVSSLFRLRLLRRKMVFRKMISVFYSVYLDVK